ncbi:UNVERIFIED_CONTAM: Cyclin-dependent kinaseB [Sesamum latifolium]|uniref:Cyclin-dependent kinaseB n=1 Tax=Sesamum latifolium TaxID=2727402 RepID=A0AAW2X4Z1_9LAMI
MKIYDFGLSRQFETELGSYSPQVVNLWYRAPEILAGVETYSTAIDMSSVGYDNMFIGKFLAAATILGAPLLTELGFDLSKKLLEYDPNKRIVAEAVRKKRQKRSR